MSKALVKKIVEHPEKEEIISRLVSGESPADISASLKDKYKDVANNKFALSTDSLKTFQDKYLDVYVVLRDDIALIKSGSPEEQLTGSIKKNKKYKERLLDLAGQEIDIKQSVRNLVVAIEARAEQVFDYMQENPENFKIDNVLIQYFNVLAATLEKCNKLVNNAPDQVIQHNHTVQVTEQHTSAIVDAIKDVLKNMDYEHSLYFMDRYKEYLAVLQPPEEAKLIPTEKRLAEAKIISNDFEKNIPKL